MFEVGDYVIYDHNSGHLAVSRLLTLDYVYRVIEVDTMYRLLTLEDCRYNITFDYFRKLKKYPDNKLIRLLCKVYKEEDGYIYV